MTISCTVSCSSTAFWVASVYRQDNVIIVVVRENFRCGLDWKNGPDAS